MTMLKSTIVNIRKKKEITKITPIIAITAVSIIEIIALCNGINGQILRIYIFIVAGLGGLMIETPRIFK